MRDLTVGVERINGCNDAAERSHRVEGNRVFRNVVDSGCQTLPPCLNPFCERFEAARRIESAS